MSQAGGSNAAQTKQDRHRFQEGLREQKAFCRGPEEQHAEVHRCRVHRFRVQRRRVHRCRVHRCRGAETQGCRIHRGAWV